MSIAFRADSALFVSLLAPLVAHLREGIKGTSAACAVYRAGYTMMRLGEWLVIREAIHQHEADVAMEILNHQSTNDIHALTEMVLKRETGAPFPPVDIEGRG